MFRSFAISVLVLGVAVAPLAAQQNEPGKDRKKSATAEILKQLNQPWEIDVEQPILLREMLESWEKSGLPRVVVDQARFKLENPDAPDIYETQVTLPRVKGLPAAKVLRLALDQAPAANATYLAQAGYLVITTNESIRPSARFVQANFVNRPLDEALDEMSDLTGIAIVVDSRAGARAKTPINARFPSETNLAQAVRVLADMADLRAVVVDSIIYVTGRDNKVKFPSEPLAPGKGLVPDMFASAPQ